MNRFAFHRHSAVIALLLCLGLTHPHAGRAVLLEELNQKAIHKLYNDGDFEPVIDVLENFQRQNPQCSFSDSVFIAKHLAVVYTASPETREKGRYYMMRLLELVPSAKLVDMFVSDEIERVFQRVREEYLAKKHGFGLDSLTIAITDQKDGVGDTISLDSVGLARTAGWNRPRTWILGGVGLASLAVIGTFAYLYYDRNSEPTEVFVPKENSK